MVAAFLIPLWLAGPWVLCPTESLAFLRGHLDWTRRTHIHASPRHPARCHYFWGSLHLLTRNQFNRFPDSRKTVFGVSLSLWLLGHIWGTTRGRGQHSITIQQQQSKGRETEAESGVAGVGRASIWYLEAVGGRIQNWEHRGRVVGFEHSGTREQGLQARERHRHSLDRRAEQPTGRFLKVFNKDSIKIASLIFLLISHKRKRLISNTLVTCPTNSKSLMIYKLLFKKSRTPKSHLHNTKTAAAMFSEAGAAQSQTMLEDDFQEVRKRLGWKLTYADGSVFRRET